MSVCDTCVHVPSLLTQQMSGLLVVGHQPGSSSIPDQVPGGGASRMRLRTDSLDSLGDSNSLSSADHDSHDDLEQGYERHNGHVIA